MGLFDSLFGSSSGKYSQEEKQLSELEIKKLVSHEHVHSLDGAQAGVVEQAIAARRHGDGKISLRPIYETLTTLKNKNQISKYDRDGLMNVFTAYFSK